LTYNILTLLNDLTGVLHGTTLSQIFNPYGVINRAARQLLLDLDPQETKRMVEFSCPIFNTVYDYPIAADVKGNRLIDILPQCNRIPRDAWLQSYNQAFDMAKQNVFSSSNMFTMNFNTGIKSIRINAPFLTASAIINQVDSLTNNGTWATGGTASNLSVNNTNYVQGAGALQFDLGIGTGYVENSTMTDVDLSKVVSQAYLFANTYFQDGSKVTSVNLRWGSDSSNYYTSTVTQNQQSLAFQNGWNLDQFVWSTATTTGTPDTTKIGYLRITITTTAVQTGCLVSGVNSILGSILSYEYYSKYLFRDASTGAFKETVTSDNDLINLDTESYNLLFNLTTFLTMQQQQGLDAAFYDGNFFMTQYQEGLTRYKALYKSEAQKPQSTYYYQPRNGFSRFFGRFGNN